MFIAVEGMDGVGKTTVAKLLAKSFDFEYVEKPIQKFFGLSEKEYDKICNKIWSSKNPNITPWFFCLGNMLTSEIGENIIVDRHILSTYYWDSNEHNQNIFESAITDSVIPDLTIILYADIKTRMDRIQKRNVDDEDLISDKSLAFGYDKLVEYAEKLKIPHIIINTEDKGIEEVFEECKSVLNHLLEETPQTREQIILEYNKNSNESKKLIKRYSYEENFD